MGQELTRLLCPECGTSGEADPELTKWQCTTCGNGFFLRRCAECARVSYVDGLHGFRVPWACTWCGQFNRGFSQNQDPATATAAELAAELTGEDPPPAAPPSVLVSRVVMPSVVEPTVVEPRVVVPSVVEPTVVEPTVVAPGVAAPTVVTPRATSPRAGRRQARRVGLSVAVAVAGAAAIALLLTARDPGAAGMATAQVAGPRAVRISAGQGVGGVEFQGVPGQLVIVGTDAGQVTLTGQLQETGKLPEVETRLDRAAGVLLVSVRCAPGAPCTENLRLAVPGNTSVTLRQPGGRIVVRDLAGSLQITARSVDISATGLRSAQLAVTLTSGHLSAAFAAPPRQLSIVLSAAQATVNLPARAAYRVSQQIMSGYIRVAVPQSDSATSTVNARVDSGELELLPG